MTLIISLIVSIIISLIISLLRPSAPAPTTPAPVPAPAPTTAPAPATAPVPAPATASTHKELQMNTRPLSMSRITSSGIYCVRPDLTQGIVELPINGFMVPHPYTQVASNVRPMNRDRITAHAHRTSPNTPVAMGIRDTVSGEWATAQGWWFASHEEATLKAQSLGSVVYPS